jgi:quinoprotein glucose dehydrogenase
MMAAKHYRLWRFLVVLGASALLGLPVLVAQQPRAKWTTWQVDKGGADGSNYSALTQINRSNVDQLQVAWTYSTGDEVQYIFNPLIVDRTMYVLAKDNALTAIDAGTGQEIWSMAAPKAAGRRGINYWESKDRTDRRILVSWSNYLYAIDARDGKLIPSFGYQGRVNLQENLGRPVQLTGRGQTQSAGRVFENLIIVGSSTGEEYVSASPGDIRAYDVRTGFLVWTFHTIPHPGEFGYETWPKDAWQYTGGANNWGDMALDEARGIVYLPTGSPTYDFYGGDRPGNNLFGNSLIALDARTGKRLWHYQLIHHDVWDYDQVSSPQLVTVRQNGRNIDVVATAGKNGLLFVFDRVTGEPIWPIEERPVPQSDVPGERTSPTQPFPTKPAPFTRIDPISPDEVNPYLISPELREQFKELIRGARNEGIYTPPALDRWAIHRPGHSGGANLFSTSADPTTGMVYVTGWMGPSVLKLETSAAATSNNNEWGPRDTLPPRLIARGAGARAGGAGGAGRGGAADPLVAQGRTTYESTCQACHGPVLTGGGSDGPVLAGVTTRMSDDEIGAMMRQGRGRMPGISSLTEENMRAVIAFLKNPGAGGRGRAETPYPYGVEGPAPQRYFSGYGFAPAMLAPPWSKYTAYDLNTGDIKWQIPVGDAVGPGLEPGNNFGDAMVHGPKATLAITAGGLAIAVHRDRKMRIYDKDTGKLLKAYDLPGISMGAPSVYEIDGRQFIVVHSLLDSPGQGQWMAFALPPRP